MAAVIVLRPAPPALPVATPPPPTTAPGAGDSVAALRQDLDQLRAALEALRPAASPTGAPAAAASPSPLLHTLRQELRQLRADVSTLRSAVQHTASLVPPPAEAPPAPARPMPQTVEDMTALTQAQAQRDRAQQAQLDTALQAEPVEAAWADDTVGRLSEVLAGAEVGATVVRDLTCRQSACRLTVEHATRQELEQFTLLVPLQVGAVLPQLTFFHDEDATGRLHTVVYLTRQGHTLPSRVQ
jgi:hypothetical protein